MQRTLESFLRALRSVDVHVSPAEAIDAHRPRGGRLRRPHPGEGRALHRPGQDGGGGRALRRLLRRLLHPRRLHRRAAGQQPASRRAAAEVGDLPLAEMLLSGDQIGLAQMMQAAANAPAPPTSGSTPSAT